MRIHILPLSLWLFVAAELEALESQVQKRTLPVAIKKMPPDQGEKFFPHYCAFSDMQATEADPFAQLASPVNTIAARRMLEDQEDARRLFANASAEISYRQPFAPHMGYTGDSAGEQRIRERDSRWDVFRRAAEALAGLERRDWACPTGTSSCAAIGFPNSCCQDGETCVEITDTGLGNVGCCPEGATCGGSVSSCAEGNTPCASDIGGGCCIPGFVCQGVGCVKSSTVTVTPTQQPTPSPTGVTTITSTSTSTGTGAGFEPTTVVVTVIVTITPSQSTPPTTTRTTTQTTTARTTTTNTDENPIPPVRPTSSLNSGDGNSGDGNDGGINTFCPMGFYACVASAGGGCCQTGRDCQTTSCPPVVMTTIVNSNGITVAVPASGAPAATTGQCADGWFLCGREAGPVAGCCPGGYLCGTASCTVSSGGGDAGETATVAKELPGANGGVRARGMGLGMGMGVAWAVVMLRWMV